MKESWNHLISPVLKEKKQQRKVGYLWSFLIILILQMRKEEGYTMGSLPTTCMLQSWRWCGITEEELWACTSALGAGLVTLLLRGRELAWPGLSHGLPAPARRPGTWQVSGNACWLQDKALNLTKLQWKFNKKMYAGCIHPGTKRPLNKY